MNLGKVFKKLYLTLHTENVIIPSLTVEEYRRGDKR